MADKIKKATVKSLSQEIVLLKEQISEFNLFKEAFKNLEKVVARLDQNPKNLEANNDKRFQQ